jgi:pyruvate,water dikinase
MTILPADSSPAAIGNKAAALARLTQNGFPVPPFFCVSVQALEALDKALLKAALTDLRADAVAVRSSGVDEDQAGASFAGMYTTRLNVIGEENVRRALEEIRESASNPAATAYRKQRGLTLAPRVGAAVQKLILAEASGTIFTRDPVQGSGDVVLEACWGLGETLADGMITPDRWVLSRDRRVMSIRIGDKDIASVPDEGGGTKLIELDEAKRHAPCLSSDAIRRLTSVALECERLFGAPQDIEWAVASDQIWILQSRPIQQRTG